MKLSAQVRLAPGNSVAERIACLAEAGYEAVEVHSDAVDHVDEYRSALSAAGIPAMSMCPAGRSLDLVADEFSQRRRIDQTRRALDACNELGITALISVPVRGALPADTVAQDQADSYVRALEALAPHAEAAGVTITVEPLNRYEMHLLNTVADGIAIAERMGSPRRESPGRRVSHEHRGRQRARQHSSGGRLDRARPLRRQPARASRAPARRTSRRFMRRCATLATPDQRPWSAECVAIRPRPCASAPRFSARRAAD